jgi:hypothetical protein
LEIIVIKRHNGDFSLFSFLEIRNGFEARSHQRAFLLSEKPANTYAQYRRVFGGQQLTSCCNGTPYNRPLPVPLVGLGGVIYLVHESSQVSFNLMFKQ